MKLHEEIRLFNEKVRNNTKEENVDLLVNVFREYKSEWVAFNCHSLSWYRAQSEIETGPEALKRLRNAYIKEGEVIERCEDVHLTKIKFLIINLSEKEEYTEDDLEHLDDYILSEFDIVVPDITENEQREISLAEIGESLTLEELEFKINKYKEEMEEKLKWLAENRTEEEVKFIQSLMMSDFDVEDFIDDNKDVFIDTSKMN